EPAAVEPGRRRGAEDGLGAAQAKPFERPACAGCARYRARLYAPRLCAAAVCKAAPCEGPANQGGTTEAVSSRPCRATRPGRGGSFSLPFRYANQREETIHHV